MTRHDKTQNTNDKRYNVSSSTYVHGSLRLHFAQRFYCSTTSTCTALPNILCIYCTDEGSTGVVMSMALWQYGVLEKTNPQILRESMQNANLWFGMTRSSLQSKHFAGVHAPRSLPLKVAWQIYYQPDGIQERYGTLVSTLGVSSQNLPLLNILISL